ncbi:MAG: hypothetical protein C4541_05955 [Candidatus Auribacter fodinae]|jgi:hypothetical protein|uniref:PilZ domain-containing protein n=1 Tax=Candidatus Auribacter fodinae TaxID=2093366 RepID=A0A3A4R9M5_9BACT|nr:MAG: hypothetical protein C4541_05955 [Candidatus Auribacter fodinae]
MAQIVKRALKKLSCIKVIQTFKLKQQGVSSTRESKTMNNKPLKSSSYMLHRGGLQCIIDTEFPLFHDIDVRICDDTSNTQHTIVGTVIRCEKLDREKFEIDIFLPEQQRSELSELLELV